MPLDEKLLKKCIKAAERAIELESAAEQAKIEYHAGIRRIHLAGGSYREIGAALGISHQRISQIVNSESRGWLRRWFRSDPEQARLICSFCGRSSQQVDKLVAGPQVHICNGCIEGVEEILQTGESQKSPAGLKLIGNKKARCSFCVKPQNENKKLVGNNDERICDACIDMAREFIEHGLR